MQSAPKRLPSGGLVLLSGVTAAACPNTIAETARVACADGLRLVLGLSYGARLWSPAAVAALTPLLKYAFLVVGTATEAQFLTSQSDVDSAAISLMGSGPEVVVLREHKVRAQLYRRDRPGRVAVSGREALVLDPVGLGDAFLAGILSGFLDFDFTEPEEALVRPINAVQPSWERYAISRVPSEEKNSVILRATNQCDEQAGSVTLLRVDRRRLQVRTR